MIVVGFRMESDSVLPIAVFCGKLDATTEGRQDKIPHIAGLTVGCCCMVFRDFAHIAAKHYDVLSFILLSDFRGNRTSQVLLP